MFVREQLMKVSDLLPALSVLRSYFINCILSNWSADAGRSKAADVDVHNTTRPHLECRQEGGSAMDTILLQCFISNGGFQQQSTQTVHANFSNLSCRVNHFTSNLIFVFVVSVLQFLPTLFASSQRHAIYTTHSRFQWKISVTAEFCKGLEFPFEIIRKWVSDCTWPDVHYQDLMDEVKAGTVRPAFYTVVSCQNKNLKTIDLYCHKFAVKI